MRRYAMIIHVQQQKPDLTPTWMSGTAAGRSYTVTHDCILRDGKPYIYRMGELHYSRVPEQDWETELRKMRDGGIDVIASYVFWNHHESQEGVFNFTGRRDIRRFADTCAALGLPFFLRIGPWAHGEARYGGFPDWLIAKKLHLRSLDPTYMAYVRQLYTHIYEELAGCGNLIGIQVENELTGDAEYLATLQKMLVDIGFTAPIWSATAWGQAKLPDTLCPMYGGYPDAPWVGYTHALSPNANYFFSHVREDGLIGSDMLGETDGTEDLYRGKYPFLTCELGGGNQNTYHRRPIFSETDITALAVCKLGSGANGLGYYMYHGGVNPVERDTKGALVTYQESRVTGYPTDCPIVSYDFHAPLGDCGQVRDSYYGLRDIHRFLDAFGEKLAVMAPYFPDEMPRELSDTSTPRIAVRSDGERGFVFYNNHIHGRKMAEKRVTLTVNTATEIYTFPFTLPENGCGIFPFGLRIGREIVRYVTAMPVERTDTQIHFVPLYGVDAVICLADGTVHPLAECPVIDGVSLVIEKPERPAAHLGERIPCMRTKNTLSFAAFSHLRRLDESALVDHTVEYTAVIPENVDTVAVRVVGNVAAAYASGGTLLSDYFCDGDLWYIDVRQVRKLRLQVQPLLPEDRGTIYFETNIPEGIIEPEIYPVDI